MCLFSPTESQGLLTGCCCPLGDPQKDHCEYLTSPIEQPFEDFPFTPGPRSGGCGADFTSPLIVDGDILFEPASLFGTPGRRTPPLDKMIPSTENDSLSSLCSEYLAILARLDFSDDETSLAILSILCAGEPDGVPSPP